MLRETVRGALAGAAGTTALHAATYLDMLVRARPASSTPEQAVERAADAGGLTIPGQGEHRDNRVNALGALTGIATGVGVGAAYGLLRGFGLRPPVLAGAALTAALAMAVGNGPMAALGVTDPREWNSADWWSDVLPHLGFGLVTALAYDQE